MEPYEEFRNAIVLQGVKDWRLAIKQIKKQKNLFGAGNSRDDCERFFRSNWFKTLTGMDGSTILRKLKQEEGIDDE